MILRPHSLALVALLLILLGPAPALAECSIGRTITRHIAPAKAQLEMGLAGCSRPQHAWFEWGTTPNLLDWLRKDADFYPFNGQTRREATLEGLRPQTTYYYRGKARFDDGTIVTGTIESFATIRPTTIVPECKYDATTSEQFAGTDPRYIGREGLFVKFECNSQGFGGIVRFSVSEDSHLANARLKDRGAFLERAVPLYLPMSLFLPYDEFPNDTTLYVQAEVENILGKSSSEIVKVTLHRPKN